MNNQSSFALSDSAKNVSFGCVSRVLQVLNRFLDLFFIFTFICLFLFILYLFLLLLLLGKGAREFGDNTTTESV